MIDRTDRYPRGAVRRVCKATAAGALRAAGAETPVEARGAAVE